MIIDVKNQLKEHSIGHIDSYITNLCKCGQLQDIKSFLAQSEYKDYLRSFDFALYLIVASKNNHLPVVKWLLTDESVQQYVNINTTNGRPLEIATIEGHTSIVQYMLCSPELKEHADPYIDNDKIFLAACASGNLEAIKMFLEMDKRLTNSMQERIQRKLEIGFIKSLNAKQHCVMEYILLDLHLNPSNKIHKHLKDYSQAEKNKVLSYFQNRDLNEKLNNMLPNKKEATIKIKL